MNSDHGIVKFFFLAFQLYSHSHLQTKESWFFSSEFGKEMHWTNVHPTLLFWNELYISLSAQGSCVSNQWSLTFHYYQWLPRDQDGSAPIGGARMWNGPYVRPAEWILCFFCKHWPVEQSPPWNQTSFLSLHSLHAVDDDWPAVNQRQ